MKSSSAVYFASIALAAMSGGIASAQTPAAVPAQNVYYNDTAWPLPAEGTSAFVLTGMQSAHAVWIAFTRYADGKPVLDSPVITLLEGSTAKWDAPGGCSYQLQLVNAKPPRINMTKPSSICSLNTGAKAIFRILATP